MEKALRLIEEAHRLLAEEARTTSPWAEELLGAVDAQMSMAS
jgi:hypothetical protein